MAELTVVQKGWIDKVDTNSAKAVNSRAVMDIKQDTMEGLRDEIGGISSSLQRDMTYEVTKIPNTFWLSVKSSFGRVETLRSLDKHSDAMKEIDSWHDLPGTKGLPPDEISVIMQALKRVLDMSQRMAAKVDKDGNRVFSDPEIGKNLWHSLVRQGVIPENAVPDKFSEVKQTFDGAVEHYQERLKEHSESLDDTDKLMGKLKKGQFYIGKLSEATIGALGAHSGVVAAREGVATVSDSQSAMEIVKIQRTAQLVDVCLSASFAIAETVITAKKADAAADAFGNAIAGVLTAAIGGDDGKAIGTLFKTTYIAVNKGVQFAVKLGQGDLEGAVFALADSLAASMSLCDDPPDTTYATIGAHIKTGLYGAVALAKLGKAAKDGDPEAMVAALMQGAKLAGDTIGKAVLADQKKAEKDKVDADTTLTEREKKEKKAELDISYAGKASGLTAGTKSVEGGINLLPKILQDKMKAVEQKLAEDQLAEPDENFENLLAHGFSMATDEDEEGIQDTEKQIASIEALIVQLKKDQMIFQLCEQVSTGGAKIVQQFFPPAKIVAATAEFVAAVIKAVQHTKELLAWLDNVDDAKRAVTVQSDAMLNRLGLQKRQTLEAGMRVALKALKVVGAVGEGTGLFAPVGTAISGSAQAAEATMDIIGQIYTDVQMKIAWTTYKKALATPQDRKLARQALRENPTLAKYAMAYGAVTERNAVAMNAMDKCGLNNRVLTNPKTSVKKVVMYLETLYAEDPVLLKAVPVAKAWYPGSIELTVESWGLFNVAAQKKAKPKLQVIDVSMVNVKMAAFNKLEDRFDDLDTVKDALEKWAAIDPVKEASEEARKALQKVRPLDVDGELHREMQEYVAALEAKSELFEREVDKLKVNMIKNKLSPIARDEAIGEINIIVGEVEAAQPIDDLEDLKGIQTRGEDLIKRVKRDKELAKQPLVKSNISQLENKLGPLGRLIVQKENTESRRRER